MTGKMDGMQEAEQKKNAMTDYLGSIHENLVFDDKKAQTIRNGSYGEFYNPVSESKRSKALKNEIAVKTKNAVKIEFFVKIGYNPKMISKKCKEVNYGQALT